jgi:hypothetical protein
VRLPVKVGADVLFCDGVMFFVGRVDYVSA